MIVLDTNVISALMAPEWNEPVVAWLNKQPQSDVWATAISIYETRSGLLALPDGRRKTATIEAFELMATVLRNRILAFDGRAAELAAEIGVRQFHSGQNVDLNDTYIAGIVLANDALLATRNIKHFLEISHRLINPWEA